MKKLIVNLTNHPSKKWDDDQRKAAEELSDFGIIDLNSPIIPEDATFDTVQALSLRALGDILRAEKSISSETLQVTILVQGHSGLVFNVLRALSTMNLGEVKCGKTPKYTAVYAHSRRISKELEDGKKEIGFKFERFIKYFSSDEWIEEEATLTLLEF